MVLGKQPVPGRPLHSKIVVPVPTVLAVGAVGVVFFRLSYLSSFSLSGRRPDLD